MAQKQPLSKKRTPTSRGKELWTGLSRAGQWLVVTVLAAAIGAPVGTLATRGLGGEDPSPRAETRNTNTQYLADLVQKGPFTETLPKPLLPNGLAPVTIGDASAARKLTAVQLKIKNSEIPGLSVFAHMEVYGTESDARMRGRASMRLLTQRYETGLERGTVEGFCVYGDSGNGFWTCAGVRGFVYAEVTVSPNPNANLPFATETVAALLRYGDRMTQLATT